MRSGKCRAATRAPLTSIGPRAAIPPAGAHALPPVPMRPLTAETTRAIEAVMPVEPVISTIPSPTPAKYKIKVETPGLIYPTIIIRFRKPASTRRVVEISREITIPYIIGRPPVYINKSRPVGGMLPRDQLQIRRCPIADTPYPKRTIGHKPNSVIQRIIKAVLG